MCHAPTTNKYKKTNNQYELIVGDLQYLADLTRPDITYITGILVAANYSPKETHFHALKNTIRYFRGTLEMGIVYQSGKI